MEPTQACYWIIGANTERPALAVDLHDKNANLTAETFTMALLPTELDNVEMHAIAYAQEHGVSALNVSFDWDSTQFYATC